jgi:hypothetical protein
MKKYSSLQKRIFFASGYKSGDMSRSKPIDLL